MDKKIYNKTKTPFPTPGKPGDQPVPRSRDLESAAG
jgi:hypothetical protein